MFISIQASTGADIDINTSRIDWILDKGDLFHVHIGGDTISITKEVYWGILVPILFPNED